MIEAWDDELKAKRETAQPRFCQQCGAARPEGATFCPNCGRSFAASAATSALSLASSMPAPPTSPAIVPVAGRAGLAITLSGLAWIGVALADGYLAYLQWSFSPYAGTTGTTLQSFALLNALAAIVTLSLGALLLVGPTRGRLTGSVVWGVLSVVGGVVQMAGGATHWTIFVGTAGAAVAAMLAWVARTAVPAPTGP